MLLKVKFIRRGIKLKRIDTRDISQCDRCVYWITDGWCGACTAREDIRDNCYVLFRRRPYNILSDNYGYIPEC